MIEKCLGRRLCSCCGKSFNVADINLPASATEPAIKMPPLNPPASCVPYLEMRSDDNYATIKRRLEARRRPLTPDDHSRLRDEMNTARARLQALLRFGECVEI